MMSPVFPSAECGLKHLFFPIPASWVKAIESENWQELDSYASEALKSDGELRKLMEPYGPFSSVEHILALRRFEEDEDGIWHDDGSRDLAFSLSLNLRPENIQGGELSLRQKGSEKVLHKIGPRALGELTLFATGGHKWEHKTGKVTRGHRLVLAGWLTK